MSRFNVSCILLVLAGCSCLQSGESIFFDVLENVRRFKCENYCQNLNSYMLIRNKLCHTFCPEMPTNTTITSQPTESITSKPTLPTMTGTMTSPPPTTTTIISSTTTAPSSNTTPSSSTTMAPTSSTVSSSSTTMPSTLSTMSSSSTTMPSTLSTMSSSSTTVSSTLSTMSSTSTTSSTVPPSG